MMDKDFGIPSITKLHVGVTADLDSNLIGPFTLRANYMHMKEEQKLLNLSYQESLRQKEKRMAVWDPGQERAVFWEIKTLIMTRYRALRKWAVCLYP